MLSLYDRIEQLCANEGVNVTEMCREAGVPRSALSDYKAGRKKSISLKNMEKMADYFGTTVDYLMGRTDDPENDDRFGLGISSEEFVEIEQKETAPIDVVDEDLRDYLDELRNRPEMRMLFSTTKTATKAQIEAIVKMVEEMQGNK